MLHLWIANIMVFTHPLFLSINWKSMRPNCMSISTRQTLHNTHTSANASLPSNTTTLAPKFNQWYYSKSQSIQLQSAQRRPFPHNHHPSRSPIRATLHPPPCSTTNLVPLSAWLPRFLLGRGHDHTPYIHRRELHNWFTTILTEATPNSLTETYLSNHSSSPILLKQKTSSKCSKLHTKPFSLSYIIFSYTSSGPHRSTLHPQ